MTTHGLWLRRGAAMMVISGSFVAVSAAQSETDTCKAVKGTCSSRYNIGRSHGRRRR